MDYGAQFHALDAIKLQETLMPNLPLTWGIPSLDGFGGGITPSRRYSLYSTLLQPPEALPAVDGRLGERLTLRSCRAACIPALRWLRATDTRTVITDKVFDFWHGAFYTTRLCGNSGTALLIWRSRWTAASIGSALCIGGR